MSIDTELIVTTGAEASIKDSHEGQQKPPENAQEWVSHVEQKLFHEVITKQQAFQREVAITVGGETIARPQDIARLNQEQIRALVEVLTLEDVEHLLKNLEGIDAKDEKGDVKKEVVLFEHQLEAAAVEKAATRRQVESVARHASSSSLQQEVFENFAKYLGKDAEIRYEGSKLEVHMTSDGKYIITVPAPTFENMIAVAQQLSGRSPETYGDSPQDFAQQLMDAALIMDQQAIFSAESVEALYNTGYQLKRVFDTTLQDKSFTFEQIQQEAKDLFGRLSPQQRTELLNKIYLGIFLGKHDVTLIQDEKGIHIQKEGRGKLYDALFERFTKFHLSDEGKRWLLEHGYSFDELRNPKNKEKIIKAYDDWLCDPKRQYDMLHRLKKFIEAKAIPGSESGRLGVLLSKWRHMLLSTDAARKINERIDEDLAELHSDASLQEQLQVITKFFQPEGSVEKLNYLPSDVLRLFRENAPGEKRNEAACIIADSYIKNFLQDRGFSVFTHLEGKHAKLIAVDGKTGKAYFVDPNIPQNILPNSAVEEIIQRKILDQLLSRSKDGKRWEIKRKVLFHTSTNGIITDSDALLTSGLLANMIDPAVRGKNMSTEVAFAAAQRAAALFPDNPIAWLRLAQLSVGAKQKEYLAHAHNLDSRITEKSLNEKMLIGAWETAAGGGFAMPANPSLIRIINVADQMIAAKGGAANVGIEILDTDELVTLRDMLQQQLNTAGLIGPDVTFATERLLNVFAAIDARQRAQQVAQQAQNADRVSVFYLSQREQEELGRMDRAGIEGFIEREINKFSRDINPGAFLPKSTEAEIQSRLRDLRTLLSARTADPPGGTFPEDQKREVIEFLKNIDEMFEGAPRVAGLIESGNPEYQKAATENANQMDNEGGMNVLHTLYSFHGGRPGGLVSDLRREMKKVMQANLERTGSYFIVHEDYLKLPQTVVPQIVQQAREGVGDYAQFRFGIDPITGQRTVPLPPDQEIAQIKEQVEMDIKFAQIIFTVTGEASALYIRGRLPDGIHDPGATSFLNAEWQDTLRYGGFTKDDMRVADLQMKNAAELHLKEKYGKVIAKRITKNKELFRKYVEQNAVDILAPQVNMWWENRFVRTLPMIISLNAYEKAQDERNIAAGLPQWRSSDGSQIGYQEPNYSKVLNSKETYNFPLEGNPEFGIMLRAFLYKGSITSFDGEARRIFETKGADYFPDVIIEPFAYQAAGRGNNSIEGIAGDRRFIALFTGANAVFLDVGPIPPGETEYQQALRRFKVFQEVYRPRMDAIRTKRINSVDRTNPNNPIANPRQTNFGLEATVPPRPEAAVADIDTAFGANAAAFRAFIRTMQNTIRDTSNGLAQDLADDPMFENQYYSPMTLIDVPEWMLDKKDLAGNTHPDPLREKLGANNKVGRYIGDVAQLGAKTRTGVIEIIKTNPNNTDQIMKLLEQVEQGIQATRGNEVAEDVVLTIAEKYFRMMHPELADWFGFAHSHLFADTDYRKIYGKSIKAMDREEIFAFVEANIMPRIKDENKKKLLRQLLLIRTRDRVRRTSGQTFLIFLLSLLFETAGSVYSVVNPEDIKIAA